MTTGTGDHVTTLTAMLYPAYTKRCEQCGGFVAISPEEALERALEAAYQPWQAIAKAMQQPATNVATALPGAYGPATDWMEALRGGIGYAHPHHQHRQHHHRHHHDHDWCGCERCGGDDCHCRCCVVNADLVVYVRLGERRLVPVTLENNRRREREIKLELSEFTSKGGDKSAVTGELLSPAAFTLGPCTHREVVIGILAGEERQAAGQARKAQADEEAKLPDVDDCRVAYADLRIVGCDNRPIRIAVATVPRDCHDYRVGCDCGCC
jgi:hypothetical protein